jgi:CheY-like chemotaxis protein
MPRALKAAALVVEDDEIQRAMVVELLEGMRLNVFECKSGEAARLILNEIGATVRLMYIDVNLSGTMTGLELANTVRREFPKTKVIVASAKPARNLPTGATFMQKPWLPLELLREAQGAC